MDAEMVVYIDTLCSLPFPPQYPALWFYVRNRLLFIVQIGTSVRKLRVVIVIHRKYRNVQIFWFVRKLYILLESDNLRYTETLLGFREIIKNF